MLGNPQHIVYGCYGCYVFMSESAGEVGDNFPVDSLYEKDPDLTRNIKW